MNDIVNDYKPHRLIVENKPCCLITHKSFFCEPESCIKWQYIGFVGLIVLCFDIIQLPMYFAVQ